MLYSRNKKRIVINGDILCRQYYNDLGEVSHLKVFLSEKLLKVLLQSIHGTAGKHPGISKVMQEIRQNYYLPSIATYVGNWARDCEICNQDNRINNTRITPALIHIPKWDLGKLAPLLTHPYQTSYPKLHGQNQDIETATDLHHKDGSKQTTEPSTDTETTCEPMPPSPSKQSDNPSTLEINDPITETIPQTEHSLSRGGKYNLRLNPNPNYSEIYRF